MRMHIEFDSECGGVNYFAIFHIVRFAERMIQSATKCSSFLPFSVACHRHQLMQRPISIREK